MKKKLLSLTLALMMCLSLLPAPSAALSDGTFNYTISDDGVSITGLVDKSIRDLVIPSAISDKPVVSVKGLGGTGITSVVVPSTVKVLGDHCFMGTKYLTTVTLSEGLETIGKSAFSMSGLTSIVLPDSVTTIGDSAFASCSGLTSVELPDHLTKIPDHCFSTCSSLTGIEIPSTVASILRDAFHGCTSLTAITIPEGVTTINHQTFADCTSLAKVELPGSVTLIDTSAFWGCSSLKSILLPTALKTIKDSAFKFSGLEEVILPYGIGQVFYDGFAGCNHLTAIYAPSTITTAFRVSPNTIVYCMPDSVIKADCERKGISSLSDASCDTRINVIYNGRRISFGDYGQNPTAVNNRTMVPLRSIFEAMGADVQWDQATSTVTATRGSNKIVMTLGQTSYQVNGVSKTMDTPPMAMNSRTMVPVRAVAESFGADVSWHGPSATVIITE